MTLPPRHFKWRMRQASIGLADEATRHFERGATFDVIWTTSMLDAAELRGLLPAAYRSLPLVVYFHENQLVYPVRKEDERDQHFSLINWASALCADAVWFNSSFNRDSMISGLRRLLKKMPDENSLDSLQRIEERSEIQPLGVIPIHRGSKSKGPLHLAWVGRWEHDKRPDRLLSLLESLDARGLEFRVTVLGQSFRSIPSEFHRLCERFPHQLEHIGYVPDRHEYERLLSQCDVVVSTADHEFFGVALLEAVFAGAVPLVPRRLVYPEIYPEACLYDDDDALAETCSLWFGQKKKEGTLEQLYDSLDLKRLVEKYDFERRARALDEALTGVTVDTRAQAHPPSNRDRRTATQESG